MDIDDFLGGLAICAVLVCALLGVALIFGDFRNFNSIAAQCKERGYIQNSTTRINCAPEVKQ